MADNALNTIMKTLLSSDALSGIASTTGASESDVSSVLTSVLPSLLNGANTQATQTSTAASFVQALTDHSEKDTSDLTSFFKNVDLTDGTKIVKHLLGSTGTEETTKAAAKSSGVSAAQVAKIVAAAAPLLMTLVGKQTAKKSSSKKSDDSTSIVSSLATSLLSNVDATSIIKSLLK